MSAALPAICILVAGAVRSVLPADAFSLAWTHSVQRSRWEEHYRVRDGMLDLDQARVQGSGAGMEPGDDAVRRDGWWTWHPRRRLPAITLTASPYAADYTLCTVLGCATLGTLTGPVGNGTAVVIEPCRATAEGRMPPAGDATPPP